MPTKILWVINPDATQGEVLNVVSGCTPISEGCAHCYAKRLSHRLKGRFGYPADDPFRVTLHENKLKIPYEKAKPTTYFVCSMGDLFHDLVPEKYILDVFEMMIENPRHIFLILTKRPQRLLASPELRKMSKRLPLYPHIWLGVSVENQKTADERIPILLEIPTASRFVSIEPMLGPVDLLGPINCCPTTYCCIECVDWRLCQGKEKVTGWLNKIEWVIVGGENGPGARPMHPNWVRSIRHQCNDVDVPFFFKGWGEYKLKEDVKLWTPDTDPKGTDLFVKIGAKKSGHILDCKEHHQVPWGMK
jgi:protein gp37